MEGLTRLRVQMSLRGRQVLSHKKRPVTAEWLVPETVAAIVDAHRAGTIAPEQTVARSFARIRAHGDPAIFIYVRDEGEATAEAKRLAANRAARTLPLYGVPVAVKDN